MTHRIFRLRLWVPVAGVLAGPGLPAAVAAEPFEVVATTGMVADVARAVGGDCLAVTQMMGPGTDPHLYRASAGDVAAMRDADGILYSGLYLEGQLGEVFERLGRRMPTVAIAEEGIPEAEIIKTGEGYGIDPHVWMDAGLWSMTAGPIEALIADAVPDCAGAPERAGDYLATLAELDRWIGEAVASIPEDKRVLVTAHDAFAYYGRAYGIEVVGIQGVSTESEAGIADIRAVVDRVVADRLPAIFIESTINPRTVQAVIEAAAEQGHEVALGPQLFADAMGEEETPEGTYPGMMITNTRGIVAALGGQAPPLPDGLVPWAEQNGIEIGRAD